MSPRRTMITLAASALVFAACSTGSGDRTASVPIPGRDESASSNSNDAATPSVAPTSTDGIDPASEVSPQGSTSTVDTTNPGDSTPSTEPDNATPDAATPGISTPDVTTPDATTPDATTTSSTTTTTSTLPALDVFDPACVVEVQSGDSLGLIVEQFDDETINIATVRAENSIEGDAIYPEQLLDICVDNGLDDVTGSERTERNAAVAAGENAQAVSAQQVKLNELLTPYGMRELGVDGVSGPVTRRHLCAARLGLGLAVTLTDMEPGSAEEQTLMGATAIAAPFTSALNQERWILVDRTCQVMFVGRGATTLDYVFPTSTGSVGFETRDQDQSRVFRYDPALENGGWHDSTDYPVPVDDPLNGNMYKPLYFDGGQAVHGANNVPTTPQSKGCVRLSPDNQDLLVTWLGLQNATGPQGGIPVTVNVQGAYPHAPAPDAVTPGNATVDT